MKKRYKRRAFFPHEFFFFLFFTLPEVVWSTAIPTGRQNANDYQEWVVILLGLLDLAHYLDVTCELVSWVNSHPLSPNQLATVAAQSQEVRSWSESLRILH